MFADLIRRVRFVGGSNTTPQTMDGGGGGGGHYLLPNATHSFPDRADFDCSHCTSAVTVFITSAVGWCTLFVLFRIVNDSLLLSSHSTTSTSTSKTESDTSPPPVEQRSDRTGLSALVTVTDPYSTLNTANRALWNSYAVSTVHSLVAIYGGWQTVVGGDRGALSSPLLAAFDSEPTRDFWLMVTCGYLFYDLCVVIYIQRLNATAAIAAVKAAANTNGAGGSTSTAVAVSVSLASIDPLMLIHHLLIIAAFSGGVYIHVGTFYMCCFLMNEVSTLFLNANYFST